jgi:cyclomaltodextrinase / maltogenic alpha-amylase / neopullulanase
MKSKLAAVLLGVFVFSLQANAQVQPQPISSSHAEESHTFHYVPPAGQTPQHVYIGGDFNNWSTSATPLQKGANDFQATINLTDGVHYYKFIVDGNWVTDPNDEKDLEIDDTFGGKNSAVMVGLNGKTLPPPPPNVINASAVAFDSSDVKDCNVASSSLLRLSIRAQQDNLTGASVMFQSDGGDWRSAPMWKIQTERGLDRYGTLINTAGKNVHYIFALKDGQGSAWIADGKAYPSDQSAEADSYSVEMTPQFETPDWAKRAIWYQIFPERFRNGDPKNDPPNTKPWTGSWFAKAPGETGNFYGEVWDRRYGGDIHGIRDELPYLRSLGVNAIYLNPIFEAESAHKYDATDYRHVDEHFGYAGDFAQIQGETDDPTTWQWTRTDKLFLDFVAEAHRQGFKVIIDGVFNHVGRPFWAFQDVVRNGRNSKYASWFDITDWNPGKSAPFHYHAWDGDDGALPAFKKDPVLGIVHGPREHIFAIARRWLAPDGDPSRGVDGFRLDAPENVPHPFWVDFRKVVKATKPDAYIDGEIWNWAQSYLSGDQFDAVMNYQFAIPAQQFFVDQKNAISCTEFNNRCNAVIFNYPFQVALDNQNLLDSHDTDRAASMFVNPDIGFNAHARLQDSGPNYNPGKPDASQRQRMLQEVAFQMTFVGAPMIYYGDEAGMWGPADPSDRQPMIWKDLQPYDDPNVQFDQGKFDWYQRLIAIRRKFEALKIGFFHPLLMDNQRGIYVFERELGNQRVYIFLNRSAADQHVHAKLEEGVSGGMVDWLDPASATLTAQLDDGRTGIIAKPGEGHTATSMTGEIDIELPAWATRIFSNTSN